MCKHSYEFFYEFNLISAILKLNEKKMCFIFLTGKVNGSD